MGPQPTLLVSTRAVLSGQPQLTCPPPRRRPLAHRSHSHASGALAAGQQVHTRAVTVTQWSVLPLGPHHKRSLGRRPPREVTPLPRASPGQQGQGRPGRGTQSVGATARPGAAGHHVGLRWEVASRVLAATTSRTPHDPWAEVLKGWRRRWRWRWWWRWWCCPGTMSIQSYCVATATFKMLTFTV